MPSGPRSASGTTSVLWSFLSSAGDGHARPRTAADEGDEDHGQPGQGEADDRHGCWFVRLVRPEFGEIRSERGPGEERRDRELADDDGKGQERATEQGDAQV